MAFRGNLQISGKHDRQSLIFISSQDARMHDGVALQAFDDNFARSQRGCVIRVE